MVKASELFGGGSSGTAFLVADEWLTPGTYSYTVPVDARIGCFVMGGGGSGAGTITAGNFATGGGGGGFAYGEYDVTAGTVLTVVVGAGGVNGGLNSDSPGTAGGTTSISGLPAAATISATGGQGGQSGAVGGSAFALGGVGSGGMLHFNGGRSGSCVAGYRQGSGGGGPATIFGAGGKGGDITVAADGKASAGGCALLDCVDDSMSPIGPGNGFTQGAFLLGVMFDVSANYGASSAGSVDDSASSVSGNFTGAGGRYHTTNSSKRSDAGNYGGGGGGAASPTWAKGGAGGGGYAAIIFRRNSQSVDL